MGETMTVRYYAIHSGLLDVHRYNFECALGDLMSMYEDVFPFIVEMLVATCRSYNDHDWYLQYDHFDTLVEALSDKCISVDEYGTILLGSAADGLEHAIANGSLWRAYELLARYLYVTIRESIPRTYSSLEIPDIEPVGYRERMIVHAHFTNEETTGVTAPTPNRYQSQILPFGVRRAVR